MKTDAGITTAEVLVPCDNLNETLKFFTTTLAFRLEAIFPADNPQTAVISGHGLRLRLARGLNAEPGIIRIACARPAAIAGKDEAIIAPNGTRIELTASSTPLSSPPVESKFSVRTLAGSPPWIIGRAGMQYRDLVPDRQGGSIIASHIRIPDGGPVPDMVHYHTVGFQMIYCYKGWVRVVYEDQGEPIIMHPGDCVLQAPEIRHRVLEASDGLEVIEIGCPAEHMTSIDHTMDLPNGTINRDRDFSGQRFVFHQAAKATWSPFRQAGFAARDTGIANATKGVAGVQVARLTGPLDGAPIRLNSALHFTFVLSGAVRLAAHGHGPADLVAGDAFVIPAGLAYALSDAAGDLQLLEATLPAAP